MSKIETPIALLFMQAVGYEPVRCVVKRRGRIYDMWADKRINRKIISCRQLEMMSVVEFIEWLRERSYVAKVLFPNPLVYHEVNE